MMENTFRISGYTFVYHTEDSGYWCECLKLRGCYSQGDTLQETVNNAKESLNLYLSN